MVFIFLLILAIVIICGYYFSFQFVKYYIVNYLLNGKFWEIFSKEFLIVIGFAALGLFLFVYISSREPDYFEQGVNQLHDSQLVKKKDWRL